MKTLAWFRRPASAVVSLVLTISALLPFLNFGIAHAYGLVTSRSIKMSTSAASATGVSYDISFTTATTGPIEGAVVDFCSTDPIIGDSCTAPAGFSVGTPTVTGESGLSSSGSWTYASANSGRTLTLSDASATGNITSGTAVTFTLTTATNPSATNTTFYARILTFATTGGVTTYTGDSTGQTTTGVVDAGGIALSTAAQITITAKVQEELTFCVDANATALTSCASATGTTISLGDNHGVLSTSFPAVDKTGQYLTQTNAGSGAAVNIYGTTLTSGGNTIAQLTTPTASSAGTSQFGLCTYPSGGTTANSTVVANYNGGGGTKCSGTTQTAGAALSSDGSNGASFYLGTTAQSAYGDKIATQAAGAYTTGTLVFMGNTSVTQTAGVYTTTMTFIATGTY